MIRSIRIRTSIRGNFCSDVVDSWKEGSDAVIKVIWKVLVFPEFFMAKNHFWWYIESNISEDSQPISTNKVSSESLSLHLFILRNNYFFFVWIKVVFGQHLCSILSNDVPNKILRHQLSI